MVRFAKKNRPIPLAKIRNVAMLDSRISVVADLSSAFDGRPLRRVSSIL